MNVALVGIIAAFEPDKDLEIVAEELHQNEELEVADEEYYQELITTIDEKITDNKSVFGVILKYNILDDEIDDM